MLYDLRGGELCGCRGDLDDLLRVKFSCEPEVNQLHVRALLSLAQNILRLQEKAEKWD